MNEASKVYEEIVDLFARGSTSAEVIAFQPSERTQARVRELLQLIKVDVLTAEECLELQQFSELEHFMQLVKARAQFYVDGNSF